ncbi:MAG: acetylglutamate kinase [Rhodothermales bacterium]
MTYVLYLDRYHLGDPLFLTGFARDVQHLGAPCVLVHGAGEAAERALEAQGRFPTFDGGVLRVESTEDRRIVARAARELNRQIVHTLNEAGVAAVGIEASGRGLLQRAEGGILAKKVTWLRDLVAQGAVPVVTALLPGPSGEAEEVNGGAVAGALALALTDSGMPAVATFLTKNGQNGLYSGDRRIDEAAMDAVTEGVVPEPEALRDGHAAGAEVTITSRSGLRSAPVLATRIRPETAKKTP